MLVIEGEQPLLGERMHELNGKKRIAGRLLVHELCQRAGDIGLPVPREARYDR